MNVGSETNEISPTDQDQQTEIAILDVSLNLQFFRRRDSLMQEGKYFV